MPAPLVASAETNPRSIRSISTGDEPGLDHVRAEAPDDAAIVRRARARIAATTALKSAAGEDRRQRLEQRRARPRPARYGVAKSAAFALLLRDASG